LIDFIDNVLVSGRFVVGSRPCCIDRAGFADVERRRAAAGVNEVLRGVLDILSGTFSALANVTADTTRPRGPK
jgi:hypothetical protein